MLSMILALSTRKRRCERKNEHEKGQMSTPGAPYHIVSGDGIQKVESSILFISTIEKKA